MSICFELDQGMAPSNEEGNRSFEFLANHVPMSPVNRMLPTLSIRRARTKQLWDELKSEAFGCFMIIIFGNGVVATFKVGDFRDGGDPFSRAIFCNTAWAIGVTFGAMVSFNTSGAFLNPALVLNAIVNGGFPLQKGLYYMFAQTIGCFLGAVAITFNFVVFSNEPKVWNFYTTGPQGPGVNFWNAAFNEFLGTAILSICVAAITNAQPPFDKFHVAGFVGVSVFGIGNVFGPLTGYALNPARDLGCRICYAMATKIYCTMNEHDECLNAEGHTMSGAFLQEGYWLVPILAPALGAVVGGIAVKYLIFLDQK